MSRITKQIAEEVAKAMTAEKAKNVADLKGLFTKTVEEIALTKIPEAILKIIQDPNLCRYLQLTDYVHLNDYGFHYKGVCLEEAIPCTQRNSVLSLTENEGKLLWNLEQKYKKAKKEVEDLHQEIYFTLLHTLKTYKKVQDHFPEAFEHLPKVGTPTSLAINLDALRHKISKS